MSEKPDVSADAATVRPAAGALADQIRLELASELAWTASEQNGGSLWARAGQQAEALLYSLWRNGELVGARREEAYFVRCDRSTMTQNDLDEGRLNLLIGIATVEPAAFTTFEVSLQVGAPNGRSRLVRLLPWRHTAR